MDVEPDELSTVGSNCNSCERVVHQEFYKNFGDLFDDKDLN